MEKIIGIQWKLTENLEDFEYANDTVLLSNNFGDSRLNWMIQCKAVSDLPIGRRPKKYEGSKKLEKIYVEGYKNETSTMQPRAQSKLNPGLSEKSQRVGLKVSIVTTKDFVI